jgi:hypothetical protein
MFGLIVDLFTDPLKNYDRNKTATVPSCEIHIVVGHYTKTPHKYVTGPCSGVTMHGCLAGGGTYERFILPDVPIPPKDLTPFPGAHALAKKIETPNGEFAQRIKDDIKAARAHAKTLLSSGKCDCTSIKIRVLFTGFDDGYIDSSIKGALKDRGVTEMEEVVPK